MAARQIGLCSVALRFVGPDALIGPSPLWNRKGKAHERREGKKRGNVNLIDASGSGRRMQRPQVHARAEQI